MPSAIIGAGGFVGSNLLNYTRDNINILEEEYIAITRQNYTSWAKSLTSWNTIIWCAGLSSKIECDIDKEKCLRENVINLEQAIKDFPCKKFIYISSSAVYSNSFDSHAEKEPILVPPSFYGMCKYKGEIIVKNSNAFDWMILRPHAFVGPGLRKNAVFDLARPKPELFISWDSKLQFIHTELFSRVLFHLANNYSNETVNVASSTVITPVEIAEILDVDIKKVKQPKDIVPPSINLVLDVSKLETMVNFSLSSSSAAIRQWKSDERRLKCTST
jgi:nucleoside-diphosphate-sugar epimerase